MSNRHYGRSYMYFLIKKDAKLLFFIIDKVAQIEKKAVTLLRRTTKQQQYNQLL